MEDLKEAIVALIRTHPKKTITLNELSRDLLNLQCVNLSTAAKKFGFSSRIEFLSYFPNDIIIENAQGGEHAIIKAAKGGDHITQMNRFSK